MLHIHVLMVSQFGVSRIYISIGVENTDGGIISWEILDLKKCRSHQNTKNEVTFV